MRNPARIDEFCDELKRYWHLVPQWRFGQLICNVFRTLKRDPFFLEEDAMLKVFEEFFKTYVEKPRQTETIDN